MKSIDNLGNKEHDHHCIFINFQIIGFDFIYDILLCSAFIIYFYEAIITKLLSKYNCIDEGIGFHTSLLASNLAKHQGKFFY